MGRILLSPERMRSIESANFVTYPDGALHPDRVMSRHDMFMLQQGGWEILENGSLFVLKPGDVIFLFAGRHHSSRARCRKGTKTPYIHLDREQGDVFKEKTSGDPAEENLFSFNTVTSTGAHSLKIAGLFEEIVRSTLSHSVQNRLRARALLGVLLAELSQISRHEDAGSAAAPVQRVIDLLEHDPGRAWPLDELARMVSLNKRVLTSRFREVTGKSIGEFLIQHRIRIARSILDSMPSTPLKIIAGQLGFSDEYHLSHCFRRITGVSPRGYRGRK